MDESLCFEDFVASDAYEYPCHGMLNAEESAALFGAFTNEDWEGLGAESGLTGSEDESTSPMCLDGQTSEATSDSSPSSARPNSLASTTSERALWPVPTNTMTGGRKASPPTPPTPVIPTPSGAPAHSPVPGIVSIPPTLCVNFAEAQIAFDMAPGSSQTLCPPGPAYASQPLSGRTMQGPTHPPSGAAQAPALHPYCAGPMSGPFYPWDFVATAPVAGPCPPQPWSAPVSQGNNTAAPSSARYSMEMPPPPAPALAPAMSSPVPAPSKKQTWEFADPVTPTGFVANPNNHGRFQYVNGQRIYLNGPKAKKQCSGGKQGN